MIYNLKTLDISLKPFTGNDDEPQWVKYSWTWRKTKDKNFVYQSEIMQTEINHQVLNKFAKL